MVRRRGISTRAGMPLYRSQAGRPEELDPPHFEDLNDLTFFSVPPPHEECPDDAETGPDQAPAMGRQPPLHAAPFRLPVEVAVGPVVTGDRLAEVGRPVRVGRLVGLLRFEAAAGQVAIEKAGDHL